MKIVNIVRYNYIMRTNDFNIFTTISNNNITTTVYTNIFGRVESNILWFSDCYAVHIIYIISKFYSWWV